jgi:hypothetical protein
MDRRNLSWKNDNLFAHGVKEPILSIVQDEKYPSMWRIKLKNGKLSDMVNRDRAKDAAESYALGELNEGDN